MQVRKVIELLYYPASGFTTWPPTVVEVQGWIALDEHDRFVPDDTRADEVITSLRLRAREGWPWHPERSHRLLTSDLLILEELRDPWHEPDPETGAIFVDGLPDLRVVRPPELVERPPALGRWWERELKMTR